MEDEGTPPAEHEGFLSDDVSPSYVANRWETRVWQDGPRRPRGVGSKPKTKALGTDNNVSAVDLIMLLEENW